MTPATASAPHSYSALMPASLQEAWPRSFVLYKPKDHVSGDFYWFLNQPEGLLVATISCKGPGVASAYMSTIGNGFLRHLASECPTPDAAICLQQLHRHTYSMLQQYRPGMPLLPKELKIAVACLRRDHSLIQYATTQRPLLLVRQGVPHQLQGTPVEVNGTCFNYLQLPAQAGDYLYLYTGNVVNHALQGTVKLHVEQMLCETTAATMNMQKVQLDKKLEFLTPDVADSLEDLLIIGLEY